MQVSLAYGYGAVKVVPEATHAGRPTPRSQEPKEPQTTQM
jgi:hypothetical protein